MKSIEIVSLGKKIEEAAHEKLMIELERRFSKAGIKSSGTCSLLIRLLPKPVKSSLSDVTHLRIFTPDKDDVQKLCEALKHFRGLPEEEVVYIEHIPTVEVERVDVE